jgi:hypothetical protein
MHMRVAIDLAGRGLQNWRLRALGETEHVDGAIDGDLCRRDWIELIERSAFM